MCVASFLPLLLLLLHFIIRNLGLFIIPSSHLLSFLCDPIPRLVMEEQHLVLDPSIRNWVVLPMILIMVFVGLGRHYVQQLIKSDPVGASHKPVMAAMTQGRGEETNSCV